MSATLQLAGVQRASDLPRAAQPAGAERLLPVPPPLRPLLPGLRRGSTVAITPGARSLVPALIAPVTDGGWAAVVGMPELGLLAAADAGVDLAHLALVPHPGPQWPAVVAALLDGLDAVVVAPPGAVPEQTARRLAARARQRGAVLLPFGRWPGADLAVQVEEGQWRGLGAGHGRLCAREVTLVVRGRGAATRPRRARALLPDRAGGLAEADPSTRSTLPGAPTAAPPAGAAPPATAAPPPAGRPSLTVIDGTAA